MKRYRLTEITFKTREIVSVSKQAQDSICPLCHQSLSNSIPVEQNSAEMQKTERQTAEFSRPQTADDQAGD